MNKPGDEPRSLLRRLLRKADESGAVPQTTVAETPLRLAVPPAEASPVRPAPPVAPPPPAPLPPRPRTTHETQQIVIPTQISNVEGRLQAESALEKLRQKTAATAAEFAAGKINRAQFSAIYTRYNELRQIIERLLANDPTTQAWQRVAQPGHTSFLRDHFEAQVLSYTIYSYDNDTSLATQGSPLLPETTTKQILAALRVVIPSRGNPGPLGKALDNGRWLAIIPGQFTVTMVLFSLEPSTRQTSLIQDLHRDFERANHSALERGIRTPDQLVFPHRGLLKNPTK